MSQVTVNYGLPHFSGRVRIRLVFHYKRSLSKTGEINMKIYDLSVTMEPREKVQAFGIEIEYHSHDAGGRDMLPIFRCTENDLPGGMGWATERLRLGTHDGTHIDAPWHYGLTSQGIKAKTIDECPLDWFYGDGVVLDMRHKPQGSGITVQDLRDALAKMNYLLKPGDIVCLQTGADRYWGNREYSSMGCGLIRESTLWLVEQGIKVIGTDAWGLDRPFYAISEEFTKTKNRSIIWCAHYAGMEKEYCQIEKLANLDKLPRPYSFEIACFPVKIRGASGAWTRVVAIFKDQ
jgi:kynurenine formamidase